MQSNYDILVIGSGFSGSIMARELAEQDNLKVVVIEQRSHVGGNMFDEFDEHGILVQKYGPHFLNTDKYWIIQYLERFAELVPHHVKMLGQIDGRFVRLPYNFETVQQLMPPMQAERLLALFRRAFKNRDRVPIFELIEHENEEIRAYGELLFDKAYRPYVVKQWGLSTDEIDRSVLNRVPMAMNYDERYLNKDFQRLPKHGYTNLFESMLDHPNIDLMLNNDALKHIYLDESTGYVFYDDIRYKQIIYTGAIDELFGECHGNLPYRSLDIHYRIEKTESALPSEVVSYPQADGYTRSTEYRKICHFPLNTPFTVVATEYPLAYDKYSTIGNLPYYPIITDGNTALYQRYLSKSLKYDNLLLCGRLAEYKYYNMDAVIENTFEKLSVLRKKLGLA